MLNCFNLDKCEKFLHALSLSHTHTQGERERVRKKEGEKELLTTFHSQARVTRLQRWIELSQIFFFFLMRTHISLKSVWTISIILFNIKSYKIAPRDFPNSFKHHQQFLPGAMLVQCRRIHLTAVSNPLNVFTESFYLGKPMLWSAVL